MRSILCSLALCATPLLASPQADIPWWRGVFGGAQGRAATQQKRLVAYFWLDGSAHCETMWTQTLTTAAIAQELEDHLCVSVDVAKGEGAELVQRYGVRTLPTLLFLTAAGKVDDAVVGVIGPDQLAAEVQRIRRGNGTLSSLRQQVMADPENLLLHLNLAVKLRDVGLVAESDETFEHVRRSDPRGRSDAGARLALWDVQDTVRAAADPADPGNLDMDPVRAHLAGVQVAAIRFEGWQWVADIERERGRRAGARSAIAAAWDDLPANRLLEWASEQARYFWESRDELDSKERKLALHMAQASADAAETELAGASEADRPGMSIYAAEVLTILGRCQLMNGKRHDAKKTAQRCLALDPDGPEHLQLLDLIAKN